jgi:hypothetical protein
MLDASLLLLGSASLCSLHALGLGQLGRADLVILVLVCAQVGELLLFQHLHEPLLQRLAHQHLQKGRVCE